MAFTIDQHNPASLRERLRSADVVTRPLMLDIIDRACRRLRSLGQGERTARLTRLIDAEAWADAALALLELELPLWQVRRIIYDDGEWYCALSRERELPDWLDQSIEAQHANLALAVLSAFIEARMLGAEATRPSVPSVHPVQEPLYTAATCDNFG